MAKELHVASISPEMSGLTLLDVFLATERSETPVLAHDDLLATGEFVLGATKSLDSGGTVCRI